MLDFGREVLGDLATAERREWLVTNGLGGYASGTLAGVPTRRYHGLLVAALQPPLGRTLLLTKIDETAYYAGHRFPLFANRWAGGLVEPEGFRHLERFRLEGTTPVWTFACADALLEKRVWMQPGANTTYIQYSLRRASGQLDLDLKAMVNYRDHHANTRAGDWRMQIAPVPRGLQVSAFVGAVPFYLLSDRAEAMLRHEWYKGYYLRLEGERGLDQWDDNLHAGQFRATLRSGESLTFVATTEPEVSLDGASAYHERQAYDQGLLVHASVADAEEAIKQLVLAADQFVAKRPLSGDPEGLTVIAGYHWFGDWGRDTMISLPGLTLSTGRYGEAARILRTFARFVDRGMLPNRFPDGGEPPEYNSVDAALWYVEATRAYFEATGDEALLRDLYPVLAGIVEWYRRGTRYGIRVDPVDGLLFAGEPGVQLTWMDVKIGDWVVTPRTGKPVEVNALWYNALRAMVGFSHQLGLSDSPFDGLAARALGGFARFWNEADGYCYDVLDGPTGNDRSLRPNQLLAVSLPHSPLDSRQQRSVVDACARHLLASHGLRSLAPGEASYVGLYGGDQRQRDAAYHQGTVWAWLIGPFVTAHLRVYRDPEQARSFLRPLIHHLADHGVGSVSEIFDGDPPFTPRGCIAQAWSIAQVLGLCRLLGSPSDGAPGQRASSEGR